MRHLLILALGVAVLAGCRDPEAGRQAAEAAAAAERAGREAEAGRLLVQFEQAIASADWETARMRGVLLGDRFAGTAAAAKAEARMDEVREKAEEARELRRLQALWSYSQVPAGKGMQVSSSIHAAEPVDVDGSGPRPVQLVFRDHPEWKQHAYLVLQAGDFRCAGGCQVKVSADGGPARPMAAWRPDTDEAIAMFITDHKRLWKTAATARRLSIEFPVKAGGTRTAVFETAGVDAGRMPARWN